MSARKILVSLILAAALLVLPHVVKDDYTMHLIIMTAMFMMLACSVDIIYGYAGQLNLGQAAFAAIGAYITAIVMIRWGISYWLAMPLSGLGAALIGLLLSIPTLRLRGLYLGIATMGFSEIVRLVLVLWVDVTRGPMGLPGIPAPTIGRFAFETKISFYYMILAYLVLTVFAIQRVVRSRMGKALMAIRDDEIAARAMGVDSAHFKMVAFTLGSFFAGVAGSFYAVYISFISPDAFKMMDSYMIFAMPALGGMGTLAGPLIGALVLYVLPEITRVFADYRMLWVGALLVITMATQPRGILGGLQALAERFRRPAPAVPDK
jgi:branched-chain amino acid transport system permease protein